MAFTISSLIHLLGLLLPLISSPEATPLISPSQNGSQKGRNSLILQIQEASSKLAQLESDCEAKTSHIRELETKIELLNHDIRRTETALSTFSEDKASRTNDDLHTLEDEVQLLWETSRKNNFEIHELEFRVQEAESRQDVVALQVDKMNAIVSHQWIQIQQLEQAVHTAQMSTARLKSQVSSSKCSFVKIMKNSVAEHLERTLEILELYVCHGESLLKSGFAEAFNHLKSTFAPAKQYHHQLQAYIRHALMRNEFTAFLANEEVVFFAASALITFPILSFLKLLLSHL